MVAARSIKHIHPLTVTCYANLLLGIVSFIGVIAFDHIDYSFIPELSISSWILIGLAGMFTISENTSKFLAFRYEEAAKL